MNLQRIGYLGLVMGLLGVFIGQPVRAAQPGGVVVLCYHDIPQEVRLDNFGVDQATFVNTVEYFRTHGFHFVSLHDIVQARQDKKPLPEKAVLLTFDDAYATYHDFVFPLLQAYRIPSVVSVVSGWIDKPPTDVKQKLMTWEQLQEIAKSDLVEIASHSDALHQGVVYNPQGNTDGAVARQYDAKSQTYESEEAYRRRIKEDLSKSKATLESKLGVAVHAVTWPYGKYNRLAMEAAREAGLDVNFALNDKRTDSDDPSVISRFLVYKNPTVGYLVRFLGIKPDDPEKLRVVQVDLDLIYDPDPRQTEINLGHLLDRIKALRPTTVYLQAFADPEGTGNVKSVYFPNKILPMRGDLFNRVAHQLRTRTGVDVYAWMPMLSLVLPDAKENDALRVQKMVSGKISLSEDPYKRLSPFSQKVWEKLSSLYADLAAYAFIGGVMFQDDGYLTDFEDFHPDARAAYGEITGGQEKDPQKLSNAERDRWTARKTEQLFALTERLKTIVRRYRPEAKFARDLYAETVLNPSSEEWLAQSYRKSLDQYDYVVIMAYPYMDKVKGDPAAWLAKVVRAAKTCPGWQDKTIFKVQSYDWQKKRWVDSRRLNVWLSAMAAEGARHLGYYPDDYTVDQPRAETIRTMMSVEEYPFPRKD